jgi:hypothetical protein
MRTVAPLLCVLAALLMPRATYAQTTPAPPPDPVSGLLRGVERAMNAADRATFGSYFEVPPVLVQGYVADLFIPGAIRTVIKERERAPLEAVPDGLGYRVVVEFFVETPGRARLLTASLDIKRPPDGGDDSWRIVGAEGLTTVQGIYRLRLQSTVQYAARNFELSSEDLTLSLPEGNVFLVECDDGVTGLVVIGRGEMRFSPAPAAEKGQLRLFSGSELLTTPFDSAFVRMNPGDYFKLVPSTALSSAPADPKQLRRAQEILDEQSPKSYTIDLREFSSADWYLVPSSDDFLAEVDTRRFGELTYSKANNQAEDISLFQRDRRRTISLYASKAKLAVRGRFFSDDFLRDYDVIDYNIEASIQPVRQFVQGRARLAIRARASLTTLQLRLSETVAVTSVTSIEFGPLLHLRLRGQNLVLVNLPRLVQPDSDLTLIVTYAGRIDPQSLETESLQTATQEPPPPRPELPPAPAVATELQYLLSNRSYWYPQNPVPDYATATLRLSVPEGYTCLASGEPLEVSNVVSLRDIIALPEGARVFNFRANQPLRYLSFIVSRFNEVADHSIVLTEDSTESTPARVDFHLQANPRMMGRARAVSKPAEDIVRFYTSLMGEAPFPSMTVALVESLLPGGHSPGFMVVVNEPLPNAENVASWRSDPAWFDGFPEFFLAHELAHQWWGQAVGWKNYHEQWLSEGFAQYFAALYAQKTRGEKTFTDMLRQFRRWSLSDSDQGPVHLGYRLGHIKNEPRVYRAIVYNKGAAVLHMLRRLVGDDAFFAGLRAFYEDRKFQKAGTDDFQRAFEARTGLDLDRFFDRWIYGTEIPRIAYRTTIVDRAVTVRFEQLGDLVFDLPVTVTLVYADGRTQEVVVPITEPQVERTIPTDGQVRQVQINRDNAALAEFDQRQR